MVVIGTVEVAQNGPAEPAPPDSGERFQRRNASAHSRSHHRGPGPAAPFPGLRVSDNTRTMYNSVWRGFEFWAQARGALPMSASSPLVAAYLAHLAEERRLSVATVRIHKAALAAVHKAAVHPDPTDNEGVRRIMPGIARAHGKGQKQARPLTAEALAAVKATARGRRPLGDGKRQESAERTSWRGRVDVALLATLRDGLLRRSEAAALTWGDVEFQDNGSALLQLRRSKTDQEA